MSSIAYKKRGTNPLEDCCRSTESNLRTKSNFNSASLFPPMYVYCRLPLITPLSKIIIYIQTPQKNWHTWKIIYNKNRDVHVTCSYLARESLRNPSLILDLLTKKLKIIFNNCRNVCRNHEKNNWVIRLFLRVLFYRELKSQQQIRRKKINISSPW